MKFPVPSDHVPQTFGTKVWDPYVLTMVYNELRDVYHFTKPQIYNGGYVIRTSIDDSKMAALYQAVSDNEALIDAELRVPVQALHARGRRARGPRHRRDPGPVPRARLTGSKYNGTGKVITQELLQEDPLRT